MRILLSYLFICFFIFSCNQNSETYETGLIDSENEYFDSDSGFDNELADNLDTDVNDVDEYDNECPESDVTDDTAESDLNDIDHEPDSDLDNDIVSDYDLSDAELDSDISDMDSPDIDITGDDDLLSDIDMEIDNDIPDEDMEVSDYDIDGRVLWNYDVGDDTYIYYSSAAISPDNKTIFVGTSRKIRSASSRKDFMLALNINGSKKWQYDLTGGEEVRSSPVVSGGKVCFLADYRTGEFSKYRTKLYCLDEQAGTYKFSKLVSNNTSMSSMGLSKVAVSGGKIVVVMKYIYVFDLNNGTELFKSAELQTFDQYVNPVILNNEALFILGSTLNFVSMSDYTTRTVDISSVIGSEVLATPSLDSQNNIYFGTRNGKMVAIKSDGELIWKVDFNPTSNNQGPFVGSSVAINETSGRIYFGTKGNEQSKLYCLDLVTGEQKWDFPTGRDIYSSPLIGDNGNIYFGSESQYIYSLNSDGTLAWKEPVFQDVTWPSPAMDDNGVIYIGGMGDGEKNGKIFAIQTDSKRMKEGVWSKIHKNNQNTGD